MTLAAPLVSINFIISTSKKLAWTILCYLSFLICLYMTFKVTRLFQFTFNTTITLKHTIPAIIDGIFLQIAQKNLSSSVKFPIFSLLVMTFVFLTVNLTLFHLGVPFQISSLTMPCQFINMKQLFWKSLFNFPRQLFDNYDKYRRTQN